MWLHVHPMRRVATCFTISHHRFTITTMDNPSTSAAALKLEIARLTGMLFIRNHSTITHLTKSRRIGTTTPVQEQRLHQPELQAPSKPVRSINKPPYQPLPRPISAVSNTAQKRDVIIGGVAFESSGRSLVPKTPMLPYSFNRLYRPVVAKPPSTGSRPPTAPHAEFARNKAGTLVNVNRVYKPHTSRRGRPITRNMTLDNTRRPYQSRRVSVKRKYSDKPCPRFTTTGACNRGLTCMYQHDPSKIAICWNFLQGSCANTAETCPLSHEPTPERTPLCVHFANNGRCTRANCPFPHVRVGPREGICRDFAVLGYCEKGLDCDKQHVRECPDFAEKGECTTKRCKLPHVIRANRNRKAAAPAAAPTDTSTIAPRYYGQSVAAANTSAAHSDAGNETDSASSSRPVTAEDAQIGDEFISLTFNESESEDDESEDEEDEEQDEEDEEGREPHSDGSAEHED
ncbi:Zinc finger CCCH domain-containing protein 3 [Grifola frondosa]|uniref:Zinc finger CCCH domain-containing protein 3 n=1 Tax=Grifola frondosa TaxID=5627 RepID=A0A1C7MBX0_GRIFR|nr:Zinc finger CCCH domain-containing protein 3 [Grifola frondosa]